MTDQPPTAEQWTAADQAEWAELVAKASPGHILTAIGDALDAGELEAAVGLIGVLARKDPHAADLLVRTIRYQPSQPADQTPRSQP